MMSAIALTGCNGGTQKNNGTVSNAGTGYDDIVSFIVDGYRCRWDGMSPEDQGLSQVYMYLSPFAGHAEQDIDGDGTEELLIGDQFEDGAVTLYDIFTVNPKDGSLIHLVKGGERDRFSVNGEGIIVEEGSNSAMDSFCKGFRIHKGKLEEVKSWNDSAMEISLEKFADLVIPAHLCGGYTEQREISDEEMEMFRKVTDGSTTVYAPLSVATQVVAGLNYKFYCRFEESGENGSGHCLVTIYKPIQGDPQLTGVEKL